MIRPTPSAPAGNAAQAAVIIAGIGCRRGTSAAEIIALLADSLSAVGMCADALAAIATLDRKAGEPGLLAAATHFGVPLKTFAAGHLACGEPHAATKIHALIGTHSVAEAAAGLAGTLLLPKQKSAHATCALALADADFELARFGQDVGKAPLSTASIAASRSLTSNAGP